MIFAPKRISIAFRWWAI